MYSNKEPISVIRKLFSDKYYIGSCHACIEIVIHKKKLEICIENYMEYEDSIIYKNVMLIKDVESEVVERLAFISSTKFPNLEYFVDTIDNEPFNIDLLMKKYRDLSENTMDYY